MSLIMQRYFPDRLPPVPAPAAPTSKTVDDPRLLAIIKAALDQHRSGKK